MSAADELTAKYLAIEDVARVLRKSPKTVYRYLRLGLPKIKIGQSYLVRRDELVAWIESQRSVRKPPFRRMPPSSARLSKQMLP
jgi:excisionase family DNA binding protein